MYLTLLYAPPFSAFFSQSQVFMELRGLVTVDATTNRKPEDTYTENDLHLAIQLCAETLVKHNLSAHHLTRIELLDFIDEDNSPEVRAHFKAFTRDSRAPSNREAALTLQWMKSLTSLALSGQLLHEGRNMAQELRSEFQSFASQC